MTYKKLIENLEKGIGYLDNEIQKYWKPSTIEHTKRIWKMKVLKAKLFALKQARQITLKEELEFLENCEAKKILLKAGIHNALAVLELNERIRKIKEELR